MGKRRLRSSPQFQNFYSPLRLCTLSASMRTLFFLAIVSLSCCLAQDSHQPLLPAQAFVPAAGQTFYLDLDTAEGSFSQWRHDDLGSLSAMRATLWVPKLRKEKKWAPLFTVLLINRQEGQTRNSLGLQLFAPTEKPPLEIRLVQTVAEKSSFETLNRTVKLDEKLNVEMIWQTPHMITIRIGDSEPRTINVSWSVNSILIYASTGEMKIDPLVLGSIGK